MFAYCFSVNCTVFLYKSILMKSIRVFAVMCCGLALVAACKKSDDDSPAKQKLRAGKWQIAGEEVTQSYMGKDTTIDYYGQWRSCEQDDLIIFEDGGNGITDENTQRCPEDAQVGSFTWELQSNDTKLKIVIGGHTEIADITELTDSLLKLRSVENDSVAGPVTYVDIYKKVN